MRFLMLGTLKKCSWFWALQKKQKLLTLGKFHAWFSARTHTRESVTCCSCQSWNFVWFLVMQSLKFYLPLIPGYPATPPPPLPHPWPWLWLNTAWPQPIKKQNLHRSHLSIIILPLPITIYSGFSYETNHRAKNVVSSPSLYHALPLESWPCPIKQVDVPVRTRGQPV